MSKLAMTDASVEPNEKQPKLDEYFSSYEDLEVSYTLHSISLPIDRPYFTRNFSNWFLQLDTQTDVKRSSTSRGISNGNPFES